MTILNFILKFIVLVLITFFTCQVVTNGKKRISYIGTLLICFSSAVIEYNNSGLMEALIAGELILLSVNNLLYNKSKMKFLYVIAVQVRTTWIFITFKYKFPNTNRSNYFNIDNLGNYRI